MQLLPNLPDALNSRATAINNSGDIVGYSWRRFPDSQSRGWIYRNEQLTELLPTLPRSLKWKTLAPSSINELGHITGSGIRVNQFHSFILTPSE